MARYDHLRLVKLPEQLERRKPPGVGRATVSNPKEHSEVLRKQLADAVETQRRRKRPEFVDPSLILRVQVDGPVLEEDWERLGLTVLSTDPDRTLVLFSSSGEMNEFMNRLEAFAGEKPEGQKNPPYAAFASAITAIGGIEPKDRIGMRCRESGLNAPEDFTEEKPLLLDVELWDFGKRELRERKAQQIENYVGANGGEILDRYIGPSITMLRLRSTGAVIRTLLGIEEIASIDLPPVLDHVTEQALEITLADLPKPEALAGDAPIIGIIDSGVNDHPLIADILVGAIGVPEAMGTADDRGHGTCVGGIAAFGDLRGQIASGTLQRGARLCSARVVNEHGVFDDKRLVPSQMRDAIQTLNGRFGCRLFVVALGDKSQPYRGGKVGSWAATLDELARELDIVIVVSAGNGNPPSGERLEDAINRYPDYLLEPPNRILEPAGALNVITVGSLAQGEGLEARHEEEVKVRPITKAFEPSPFTRSGPGVGGSIKPDVVDIGGTLVFDPVVMRLQSGAELSSAGVLTIHHRPIQQLFTSKSGTSYAAPLVAFKASQVLRILPDASANLVRALIINAASVPNEAMERLSAKGDDAVRSVCGHGYVDLERAAYSDDSRVVLYTDDELALDYFAVYEVPIPQAFHSSPGSRTIRVTLAFDPPVRHTRLDYAGVGMSFRLLRGCDPELIFEHFRKRKKEDGKAPEIGGRFSCPLEPGAQLRERSTVQTASVTFKRSLAGYGEKYYVVVRCESGWATDVHRQRFALVVELSHQTEVRLYEQVRVRIKV